jgi:hypothetical protein
LSPTNKLTIFFTLNGILMGSSRIVVWNMDNLIFQANQFQSIHRWIVFSQPSACSTSLWKRTLAMTWQNLSNIIFWLALEWFSNEIREDVN